MAAISHRLCCEVLESRRTMAADLADPLSVAVESVAVDGLRAAEIQLAYDPHSLSIQASDISPGEAWKDQATLVTNVDADAGSVRIFLFTVEPIDTEHGKLVDLHFEVNEGSAVDNDSIALSHVRLNEGELESNGLLSVLDTNSGDFETEDVFKVNDNFESAAGLEFGSNLQSDGGSSDDSSGKACGPWSMSEIAREQTNLDPVRVQALTEGLAGADTLPQASHQMDPWQLAAPLVKLKPFGQPEAFIGLP